MLVSDVALVLYTLIDLAAVEVNRICSTVLTVVLELLHTIVAMMMMLESDVLVRSETIFM